MINNDILNIILPAVNTILVVFMVVMIILMKKRLKERYDASILKIEKEEEERKILFENTKKEAEALKKELLLEAKEDAHRLRMEVEKESRERRTEIQRLERRLLQREETLDKKSDMLDKKERELSLRASEVDKLEENIKEIDSQKRQELEIISNMSSEEAKTFLLNEIKKEITYESAVLIKEFETKLKEESENKAKEIITGAIQRYAADHVSESTVHVVALPNDEMKGRIIGREGRNIRTLEMLTGVDLIIDDTPEAVVLSSFDPVRREIAKIALERLVLDGRIHPTKIEEMVERAKRDIENEIKETGEQALFETGINGVHTEIVKLLGKLKFRTSYGQNVLKHSIEVAYLAGTMALELGLDANIAKRAGLLHDIGKALDHEIEGPHAVIGYEFAKRYNESDAVAEAIGAHHEDIPMTRLESILVQASDAISAARPGARRETLHAYIKRLNQLESIANSYEGVEKSYVIQAGREIRIIVKPDIIDDLSANCMARDIVKRIERELEFPGQIKINVIRETRAIEFAK
ncbi:2',3'-cyclic-nucleotide 2'-phosphodiesterase [Candidatus Arthromitus sp. SFB-mouse-SU]|uniref:ribonuclease Y n=1 Tax=unclassified Candidatus Neoarthromitus TaxID=2638829 RepID=UPI0002296978|nr:MULTISPECIES: ribonuclease Y [unclassified Candidatus Arthromitus]EIA27487.1 2',3'-cyclic-nucleotide 2'-phosphodiesterase [Candidatus Arthromitus sp. SFB-co]EIA29134.1 2',3'-cyclic-nucleotide 2'-phosphodiesterase [Candidatus Arthromitus sp. SFB-4]EIA30800.1 2',3'-cyclic-nucleotide 2'-phosphodiesterase [Candidatus Arthromitus sp. SFB-mouse-SU]AID44700.1 Hydrolase,HAD superfamily [Candidatus Arthromitus sp. SFB-mouse-NL]EGX28795.1 2',3'-cyclic-nucleotide 2'-phosphodiesterase [Candidatus Arthr